MSAGLHIGFSFQFQFTVVSDVYRLLCYECMFVALDIHCKHGCLDCQGGGKDQTGFAGFGFGRNVDGSVGCQSMNGVILGVASHSNTATDNLGE